MKGVYSCCKSFVFLYFLVVLFQNVIDFVFGEWIVFVKVDEFLVVQAENAWLLITSDVLYCYWFCPALALLTALSIEKGSFCQVAYCALLFLE